MSPFLRRHSEVGDGREAARGGFTAAATADAGDPLPPPGKRPRVKLERDAGGGDSSGSNSSLPPTSRALASPRRGTEAPSMGGTPGGRLNQSRDDARGGSSGSNDDDNDDDDDGDDPLVPYSRIEAETVSDEGLEELLHTGRRDGFLDLRRYRKPGWPRPLRVTRLEASHGKR